jgi:hypothetical protein
MIKFQVLLDGWSYFGLVETGDQVRFWYIGTFVLLRWPLGWCYSTVVTTIDSYNISWCLQTCHFFSRQSILCWLLLCNKYSEFIMSTEYMKISIIWSRFESLRYHKLMAHDY